VRRRGGSLKSGLDIEDLAAAVHSRGRVYAVGAGE